MAICQYFLKGTCKFGKACFNEHPTLEQSQEQATTDISTLQSDLLTRRPLWPFSGYAAHGVDLLGDLSPEEVRLDAYFHRFNSIQEHNSRMYRLFSVTNEFLRSVASLQQRSIFPSCLGSNGFLHENNDFKWVSQTPYLASIQERQQTSNNIPPVVNCNNSLNQSTLTFNLSTKPPQQQQQYQQQQPQNSVFYTVPMESNHAILSNCDDSADDRKSLSQEAIQQFLASEFTPGKIPTVAPTNSLI